MNKIPFWAQVVGLIVALNIAAYVIVQALNYYVPPTVPCSEGRKDARGMQLRCVVGK